MRSSTTESTSDNPIGVGMTCTKTKVWSEERGDCFPPDDAEFPNTVRGRAQYACEQIYELWGSVPSLFRDHAMQVNHLVITPEFSAVVSDVNFKELDVGYWKEKAHAIQEFEDATSRLRDMLKVGARDFPDLKLVLSKFGLQFTDVPLRFTPGDLNKKFDHWIESSEDAMATSLFSSVGVWTSPNWANEVAIHSVTWIIVGASCIIAGSLSLAVWPHVMGNVIFAAVRAPISMITFGIVLVASGINDGFMWICLSKYSNVQMAKRLMVLQSFITMGAGLIFTVASACDGPWGGIL